VLTGERPFAAPTAAALLQMHVSATPPAASAVRPGLPGAVDAALAHGLAKDPAVRPATAGALVHAIASGLSRAPAPRRRRRRRRRGVAVGAALALAAAGVGAGALAGVEVPTIPGVGDAPAEASGPTVPGPDGERRAAAPLPPDEVPGLARGAPGVIATVGGVDVLVVDEQAERLADRLWLAQWAQGARLVRLERNGQQIADIARSRDGSAEGVLEVRDPPERETVVLRGASGAVETYAVALSAAMPDRVRAPRG
jgi:hypothetical protein